MPVLQLMNRRTGYPDLVRWIASVMVIGGCLLAACSNPSSVANKPVRSASTTTWAPATTTTTYPVTFGFTLAQIFRNEGQMLMGAEPPDSETDAFVSNYQGQERACEAAQHSDSCPLLASAEVDAQEYLQQNNQQAISDYQAEVAHQQYMNTVCSSTPSTDPNYPPDQGPNQFNANPDCPYGTPANPYPG